MPKLRQSAARNISAPLPDLSPKMEIPLAIPPFSRMLHRGGTFTSSSIQWTYLFCDLALAILNFLIALVIHLKVEHMGWKISQNYRWAYSNQAVGFLVLYCSLTILFCGNCEIYDARRSRPLVDRGMALLKAILLATGLLMLVVVLLGLRHMVPLLLVAVTGALNITTFAGWRLWNRHATGRGVLAKTRAQNVLIVGHGRVGLKLARFLEKNPHLGYAVVGFLDDTPQNGAGDDTANLSRVARANFVDQIFIASPADEKFVRRVLEEARQNRLDVKMVPEIYDELTGPPPLYYIGQIPVLSLHREPIPVAALMLKRAVDIVLSSILLILTAPAFAIIALAIKLDSKGPVFYFSQRVGKKGAKFTFYKFRTMSVDADQHKQRLRLCNQRSGPFFKMSNDPRVTRVGRWLRKFSLDELPQLWSVLNGDMSLVGPRPHPLDDYEHYQLEHLRRLDVTPGITGLWQVSARRDPSFDKNLALDLEYIENWSPWMDVKILCKTIPAILRAQGQ